MNMVISVSLHLFISYSELSIDVCDLCDVYIYPSITTNHQPPLKHEKHGCFSSCLLDLIFLFSLYFVFRIFIIIVNRLEINT